MSKTDPDGGDPSTHTDQDGNIVQINNDGDLGIYKHDNASLKGWDGKSTLSKTGPGVSWMGNSLNLWSFADWDALKANNFNYQTFDQLPFVKGADIDFDSYWASDILKGRITNCTSFWFGYIWGGTGKYNVKTNNPDNGQDGSWYFGSQMYSRLYVSAREVGNIMAGMAVAKNNVSPDNAMLGFGALNQANNSKWGGIAQLIANENIHQLDGMIFYGEDLLSGMMISYGYHFYQPIMNNLSYPR